MLLIISEGAGAHLVEDELSGVDVQPPLALPVQGVGGGGIRVVTNRKSQVVSDFDIRWEKRWSTLKRSSI